MVSGGGALALLADRWQFKCPYCGMQASLEASVCSHCGASLSGAEVELKRREIRAARTKLVRAAIIWIAIFMSACLAVYVL